MAINMFEGARRIAKLIAVFIAAVSVAHSADQSLTLGSVPVRLGSERMKVFKDFNGYRLQCVGNEEFSPQKCQSWLMSSGDPEKGFVAHGNVAFSKAGRVESVIKYYETNNITSPAKLLEYLYEVLRQYESNGRTFVTSLGEARQPGFVSKVIFFKSGNLLIRRCK